MVMVLWAFEEDPEIQGEKGDMRFHWIRYSTTENDLPLHDLNALSQGALHSLRLVSFVGCRTSPFPW